MAYATISTWKLNTPMDDQDAMWRIIQEKYVPASKALGATNVTWIETGEGETALISMYPDEAACNAAEEKRAALRAEGASEFDATMTGEMRGEIKVSG
jgi:hypothetical protein